MFRLFFSLLLALTGATACEAGYVVKKSAAYEVPLESREERLEFLSILQEMAAEFGFHVDHASEESLARRPATVRGTFSASVWKGNDDEESVASAMDLPSNLGKVWLTFPVGSDPDLSARFRDSVIQEVKSKWPETKELPLLDGETIPLPEDLLVVGDRYILDPSAAHRYEVPTAP